MTIKTQIYIHKFGSFLDPQIWNLPGSTNSGFYRKKKFEILPYCVIQNSIGFYNLKWKKTLTETKIHKKKTDVQIQKQRNLLTFVKSTLNHKKKCEIEGEGFEGVTLLLEHERHA